MTTSSRSDADLLAALAEPHAAALAALEERPFEAIAWCSAHLAAADGVLYRTARRRLPEVRGLPAARYTDRALQRALCRLDRLLTGDVHVASVPVEDAVEQVRSALEAHAAAERVVARALEDALDAPERQRLVERLALATSLGPTRPHPHTRPNPLVCAVDALADRLRDVMDNRLAPTGRPRPAARATGPWGAYLTGQPWPARPSEAEAAAPGTARTG